MEWFKVDDLLYINLTKVEVVEFNDNGSATVFHSFSGPKGVSLCSEAGKRLLQALEKIRIATND